MQPLGSWGGGFECSSVVCCVYSELCGVRVAGSEDLPDVFNCMWSKILASETD
jgi:hypothetical protein